MSEVKIITFVEDPQLGLKHLIDLSYQWFHFNKDRISVLSGVYNAELVDEPHPHYNRSIVIRYEGEETPNPQECKHLHKENVKTDPTCLAEGSIVTTCKDCGLHLGTTVLPKVDHKYTYVSNRDATCTEDGTLTGECVWCHKTIIVPDPGSALGHDYIFTPNHDETCTEDGTETGICKESDDTIIRVIPGSALGHIHEYISDNNATCTEDGTETAVCPRCGDTQTRVVPGSALGHDLPNTWTIRVAPTCTEAGLEFRKCTRCDYEESRAVDATGHDMSGTWKVRTQPTCTTEGLEYQECTVGDYEITRPIAALGHDMPATWTVRTPATEQAAGVEFRKCTRCDYEETRAIAKLEHQWISNGNGTHNCVTVGGCNVRNETCSPNGYGQICTKCGYKTPEDITLVINTSYINGMTVGNAFSQTLQANVSDVTWSIYAGSLPPGITMTSTGVISGNPTAAGVYNFTVKAVYHQQTLTKAYSVNVASIMYTVTFNANGGTASESSRKVAQGSTIGTLPTCTRNGYEFGGWFTALEGGLKVDSTYSVSSNVTLYARWGQGTDIEFGDATSTFNIQYNGDRTNYNNNPYTIYYRPAGGAAGTANLVTQIGISSKDKTSNMTSSNKSITLYMKVTNNGNAGNFDIGFDCDSYCGGSDKVRLTRLSNGVRLGSTLFDVTVPYTHTCWIGQYSQRTANRYNNMSSGSTVGDGTSNVIDTGYALTMNNIFINSGSYVILEVKFQMP